MFRRPWPALTLACALLLLAATAVPATESSDLVSFQTPKAQGLSMRAPQPSPVTDPGEPGDDDIPQRSGDPSTRKPPTSSSAEGIGNAGREASGVEGWRFNEFAAGLRWYLVRVLGQMR